MIQHIVNIGDLTCYFKETNNIFDVKIGGVEVFGQANDVTEFVQNLRLKEQWIPYGYHLRVIYRALNSKNMSAFLYRIGQEF